MRRHSVDDAGKIAEAVRANLDHLRPWMPWAEESQGRAEVQAARLKEVVSNWEAGTDYIFLLMEPSEQEVLGIFGLHRRIGEGGLEIGYWLRQDQTGKGLATMAAGALTEAALQMDGIERVEIHCDEANVRSAAVPRRLGFTLDRIESDEISAPAEVGRSMIWIRRKTRRS